MGSNGLAFKAWAQNEGITASAPLEQLKDARIGIDAVDYLRSLLIAGGPNEPREPLLPALGGLPFSLLERVDESLEGFKEAGIQPMFVFDGLDLACKDRASILQQSRKFSETLDKAWSIYGEGKGEEAVQAFGRACSYRTYHITRSLQAVLQRRGVMTFTAPYSAAAQLVDQERQQFVDAVAGSASCLVFGASKVIIDFDWINKTFVWVDLAKCLNKTGLNHEQFVAVCLLSGSSILPTFSGLDVGDPSLSPMQIARHMLARVGNDANTLVREYKSDRYRDLFHKSTFAIKHPVVITEDGKVEPLNCDSAPSDVHSFVGQRLPDEMYFYLSRGIVGPRVLNWRTRMEVLETPPLDGGDSQAYHDLVDNKLRPLRTRALALMTHSLHRYYQKQDVSLACWWPGYQSTALNVNSEDVEPARVVDSWPTKEDESDSFLNSAPLWSAISSLSSNTAAKKTVTARKIGAGVQLRTSNEVRANAVWRLLQDRGYINPDLTLSAWGQALKVSFERAFNDGQSNSREIEEAIFMAFELLRMDVLNKKTLFELPQFSGAPQKGSESDKAHTTLISRVACLAKISHRPIGYTGPLSRYLLAYHQMAAAVRGALRDLVEMEACSLFLTNAVDRYMKAADYSDVASNLPFIEEPDLGLSLIVKCHLDELSDRRTDIHKWFAQATDIEGDLEKAWKLWDVINAGVQAADNSIVSTDTKMSFQATDSWLARKRDFSITPNGTNGTA